MKKFLIITFLFISVAANAKNYYIKNSGNNNNSGLSDAQAWATISKVNASSFSPGDIIFFKRGDMWREQLTVPSSGTADAYITFNAYGTGAKPIINGANITTGWGDVYNSINANIWGTVSPNATTTRAMVVIDDVIYSEVSTINALTSAGKYFIKTASTPDSLFVYSTTDPDALVAEVSKRDWGIYGRAVDKIKYVKFENLEVQYTGTTGLGLYGTAGSQFAGYCIVDSCNFYANRLFSCVAYDGHSNDIFRNSTATYNGNGFYSWLSDNLTISNCSTAHNISYLILPGFSDGHGIGIYNSDNFLVEYCESDDDNYGVITFVDDESAISGIIRYNKIYNSRIQTSGLFAGGIGAGGLIQIYYNLVVNCGGTLSSSFESYAESDGTVQIYNNTFYGNSSNGGNNVIFLYHGDNYIFKNNIILTEYGDYRSAFYVQNTNMSTNDYNQYYSIGTNQGLFGYVADFYSTIAAWRTATSQDAHSQVGDPLFTNKASDWTLQAGSPCINKGVDVGLTKDILGNPINGLPDIGAFETQPVTIATIPVYTSSVVENATPTRIEMTYNLNLTNIVPAASAFTVNVNSVAGTVNSVAISGTKVILTLANAVVYGDIVTVAYTKPSANPLQTTSGGQVASMSAQTVTNKVTAPSPVYVSSIISPGTWTTSLV